MKVKSYFGVVFSLIVLLSLLMMRKIKRKNKTKDPRLLLKAIKDNDKAMGNGACSQTTDIIRQSVTDVPKNVKVPFTRVVSTLIPVFSVALKIPYLGINVLK